MMNLQIGLALRELRDAKKITRKQLAEMSGISYWGIENIETGVSIPKISTVLNLLRFLDADLVLMMHNPQPDIESFNIVPEFVEAVEVVK
jgi:transcriptional regulator with XRE-family HTH domain